MPIFSSSLLVQSLGALLFGASLLLVVSPASILTSSTVSLLGSSMHIRPASYIPDSSFPPASLSDTQTNNPFYVPLVRAKKTLSPSERELLAFFGLVLGFISVSIGILAVPLRYSKSSLTSGKTPEGRVVRKSSAQVAGDITLVVYTQTLWQVLSGVNVVFSSALVAWIYLLKSDRYGLIPNSGEGLDLLANNIVFTFGLSDMLFWGYLYTVLKEERREVLLVRQKRSEEDEEDAVNKGEVR